jgi:hypothetical protein
MAIKQRTAAKPFPRLIIATLGLFAVTLGVGRPLPARAQESPYPWCAVKDDPECIYMTFQQCEESVDWHGICENNPNLPPPRDEAPKQTRRR